MGRGGPRSLSRQESPAHRRQLSVTPRHSRLHWNDAPTPQIERRRHRASWASKAACCYGFWYAGIMSEATEAIAENYADEAAPVRRWTEHISWGATLALAWMIYEMTTKP